MHGRRVADGVTPDELEPGDYNVRGGILWGRTPNGTLCRIDERWTVVEEADGIVTVDPSIEVHGGGGVEYWHGHLKERVWVSV